MKNNGFSLLELLLVIAIIGICSTLAYPCYQDALVRARRVDGQIALLKLANNLEQYYSSHHTYEEATLATGHVTDVSSSNYSAQNWYKLAITNQTGTSFNLQATPIGVQAAADKACQVLTFNHLGIKGPRKLSSKLSTSCW